MTKQFVSRREFESYKKKDKKDDKAIAEKVCKAKKKIKKK